MKNIGYRTDNNILYINIDGRIDASNAPEYEEKINEVIKANQGMHTVLDADNLEYISSAGLRVLLVAQKAMNKQGSMVVRNVNETIAEIFDVTGFCDILTIE